MTVIISEECTLYGWFIWIGLIFWIFLTPWSIPGARRKNDSPIGILKMRFASGEIIKEQYLEGKKILETV